jgi:hypothetical protein
VSVLVLVLALMALYVSVGVGAGSVTGGAVGLPAESHSLAGVLVVVALVALGMAGRGER